METTLISEQTEILDQLQQEVPYFIEYTIEVVMQVLTWDMWISEMNRQVLYLQQIATDDSRAKDISYEIWDYGRLGIMDGGPNEIQYFERERQRCLEILGDTLFFSDEFKELWDLKSDIYYLERYLRDNNLEWDYFEVIYWLNIEKMRMDVLRSQYSSVNKDDNRQSIKDSLNIWELKERELIWFIDLLTLRWIIKELRK